MQKEDQKRTFESELLILPALKMVLVEPEENEIKGSKKRAKQKVTRDLKEDIVLRIIDKLIAKE